MPKLGKRFKTPYPRAQRRTRPLIRKNFSLPKHSFAKKYPDRTAIKTFRR